MLSMDAQKFVLNYLKEKYPFFLYLKFGDNNLSIGSDFNGTDYLPYQLKNYDGFYLLKELLLKQGYSNETIDKIFYKNAENYFKKSR